jgi:hypothetical protein
MKLIPYRDIILVKKSKSVWAGIIKLFLKQPYIHAEYVIGDWLTVGTDLSRPVSVRPFGYNMADVEIWRLKSELTERQQAIIVEELQKSTKIKYDWWEAVCVGLGVPTKDDKRYICISLIVSALQKAGCLPEAICDNVKYSCSIRPLAEIECPIMKCPAMWCSNKVKFNCFYKGFYIFTKSGYFEKMG